MDKPMKTEFALELDFQIKFVVHPAEPTTRDYPGAEGEIEILDIEILGCPINKGLFFDAIMIEHGPAIIEWCEDHAKYEYESEWIDNAEYQMEDR